MRLVAWDTSSKTGSIAALEWQPGVVAEPKLVAEWSLSVEAAHSDRLLWAVHQVLEAARWKLADVDVWGVGVGPGSFTGVRIGVTTARTLSLATGKPLVGVSSLAALARPVAKAYESAPEGKILVIAATDACKGELFVLKGHARALADCVAHPDGGNGELWKRGVEEALFKPDELIDSLKKKLSDRSTAGWVVVGEARNRYPEIWEALPRKAWEFPSLAPPLLYGDTVTGRAIGLLAWQGFQAGLARPGISVHPRYLRASDAEIKLKAGLLGVKRTPTGSG